MNPIPNRILILLSGDDARSLDSKLEEISEVDLGRGEEIGGCLLLIVVSGEVEIFGGSRAFAEPKFKGDASFEDPPAGRRYEQTRQEAVKDDHLPELDEGRGVFTSRHRGEARLQRGPKRSGAGVFHCGW